MRRSSDDELCGFVEQRDDAWRALTLFCGELGVHDSRQAAVDQVVSEGLASLAERWRLRRRDGTEQVVCIQEANADEVTLALDYYSLPGVPTLTLTIAQLSSGEWQLVR